MGKLKYNSNCLETYVTFRVFGKDLIPEEFSKYIELEPTNSRVKGDIIGKPERQIRSTKGIWMITTQNLVKTTVLEDHLFFLLEKLEPKLNKIRTWCEVRSLEYDFHCYWHSATGTGGPLLSPQVLGRIASFGAVLDFDLYFNDDDN